MYALTIDSREPKSLFAAFEASQLTFTRATLDVGDFEIGSSDKIAIIVERKTWTDLVSSVANTHLAEQMARTVAKCQLVGARPILLIEHDRVYDWTGCTGRLGHKFIDCCINKYALEGVTVVRTENITHTKDVITWFQGRCNKGFVKSATNVSVAGKQRFRKKDFGGNSWESMLSAIRGVSKAKAKEISVAFRNANVLIDALKREDDLGVKGIEKGKKLRGDIKQALIGV